MRKEIWKAVVGYEGWYEVSDWARVKRIRGGQGSRGIGHILTQFNLLSGSKRGQEYAGVNLSKNGKHRHVAVHILVCEAFHGPRPSPEHQVNHINWKTLDNVPSNLEWKTGLQNNRHRNPDYVPCAGSQLSSKLTEDDVRDIRKRVKAGESRASIGREFDVKANQIGRICLKGDDGEYKSWKHVK